LKQVSPENNRIYFISTTNQTMKKNTILILSFLLITAHLCNAQCTGGTLANNITPSSSWQFVNSVNGGTYYTFTGTTGVIYTFSFCSSDGALSNYDTQITLLNPAGNPIIAGVDDYCGLNARLDFTCTIAGTYRVLVTKYNCITQTGLGKLAYKMTAIPTCPGGLGSGVTNVASLPYNSGSGSTSGAGNDLTATNVNICGNAAHLFGEDKVWIFSPVTGGNVTILLSTSNTKAGLFLFKGCPLNGNNSVCLGSDFGPGNPTITTCVEQGSTYYIVADSKSNTNNFNYSNLSITAPVSFSACNLGTVNNVVSLPYNSTGRTTCGNNNDITSAIVESCGDNSYLNGEEEVFSFTPASSGNINISIASSSAYTGLFLYEGCPLMSYCAATGNFCVASATDASGTKSLCGYVNSGKTYYVIVDSYSGCFPYSITISAPAINFTGSTCLSPVIIAQLPYSAIKENTSCMGDDYNNFTSGSCGTLYESGEDKVYKYTSSGSECIAITLSGTSSNSIGYQVYNGIPGNPGVTCIGNNGGANSGVLNGSVTLASAGTYYIIVDTWADPVNVQYNLTINSFGGNVTNDLPCNAIPLSPGVNLTGENSCASGTGEPLPPACWTTPNTLNTVWYSFVAPVSGKAIIRTSPGSLLNTQIAVYSGTCGSGLVYVDCNDNASSCGSTNTYMSQLSLTGLSSGLTYYIAVDGFNATTGSFGIMFSDGAISLPPTPGQDCSVPLPTCSNIITVGNPGFQSFGNICDFPGAGANCITTGERGTVWYEIQIANNGDLEFTIVPNDWTGAPSVESTDYDFVMWKTGGTGAVTCTNIANGAAPVRCNYDYLGVTGLYGNVNGTTNPLYPGFASANEAKLPVLAGEKYLIAISNYSNSVSGFRIEYGNTNPISYSPSAGTVVWTGGVDNDWFKSGNWGGCSVPTCNTNAIILTSSTNQPEINSSGANVNSLTVYPGASLTIKSGNNLDVCGNLINNGQLNFSGNTTVTLTGNQAQSIGGSLSGGNSLWNLYVNKTGSVVNLLNDIDISGDFIISNATSHFDASGKKIVLAGNLSNQGGLFTHADGAMLNFTGGVSQSYLNSGTLFNVILNHNGNGVTLLSDMTINAGGTLTLNNGKIITGNTQEVKMLNNTSSAITSGNINSYIEGNLRRFLPSTMLPRSFDFPVGNSSMGFQRINVSFYNGAAPSISSFKVNFSTYGATLPGHMGDDPSCSIAYNESALNNGHWDFVPEGSGTADMHVTLYNTNFTNAANAYTVMSSVNGAAWVIPSITSGGCITSPVTTVLRNGVSQNFTAGIPVSFGVAQGSSALPMNLLSFIAEPGTNSITATWITASELNNKGFELQRATKPDVFEVIGWVDGNGTSNRMNTYQYDDRNVSVNVLYYYRLRQVDLNGKETFSKTVAAIIRDNGFVVYNAYPNPFKESTVIRYILSRPTIVTIEITDMSGKLVKKYLQGLQEEGTYSIPFTGNTSGIRAGVYNVALWCDNQRYQLRLTETE
jgi:hypothetical protein